MTQLTINRLLDLAYQVDQSYIHDYYQETIKIYMTDIDLVISYEIDENENQLDFDCWVVIGQYDQMIKKYFTTVDELKTLIKILK